MKSIIWAQSATDDLRSIELYLRDISPDLARDTIDRLVLSARWLLDFPAAGPAIGYRRWRKWRPAKTSYVVIYAPTQDGITVVRIRHEREDWLIGP